MITKTNTIRWFIVLAAAAVMLPMAAQGIRADATSASALGNKEPGKGETAIGDLVADSFRSAMRADIAFVAASDLKPLDTPVAAGSIKSADIVALLGYPEDGLAVIAIDGAMLHQALERSVSNYPQSNMGFLQVAGVKFSFDPSKPAGDRVSSVSVGGVPASDGSSYNVAVLNSLANGALGYWKIWSKSNIVPKTRSIISAGAVEAYLQNATKLDYSAQNRITPAK